MSPIEHVIAAAKAIAINGHTPNVALIKGRVGKVPMPLIIQGLQQFKAIPKSEWQAIAEFVPNEVSENESQNSLSLTEMAEQQNKMQQQLDQLMSRITQLEQALNKQQLNQQLAQQAEQHPAQKAP
ncbi:hypothetical protein [Shewanella sp. OMA3-2]|uniref:hypothetical protein n=1 Tax=Shewanella sp. OMA3-2 TaxID=2908650 RepID=UPI001F220349|nr:hypothetical protein [Shewanella sp. OMA3-2]UJF23396.1 hypothetical protein L0B17_08880 [Shewanella sp. OMA3-2]